MNIFLRNISVCGYSSPTTPILRRSFTSSFQCYAIKIGCVFPLLDVNACWHGRRIITQLATGGCCCLSWMGSLQHHLRKPWGQKGSYRASGIHENVLQMACECRVPNHTAHSLDETIVDIFLFFDCTDATNSDCAIFHASACSRPPSPITRTLSFVSAMLNRNVPTSVIPCVIRTIKSDSSSGGCAEAPKYVQQISSAYVPTLCTVCVQIGLMECMYPYIFKRLECHEHMCTLHARVRTLYYFFAICAAQLKLEMVQIRQRFDSLHCIFKKTLLWLWFFYVYYLIQA